MVREDYDEELYEYLLDKEDKEVVVSKKGHLSNVFHEAREEDDSLRPRCRSRWRGQEWVLKDRSLLGVFVRPCMGCYPEAYEDEDENPVGK